MNKRQSNKLKMYQAVLKVWDDNRALWEQIPIFVLVYDELKKRVQESSVTSKDAQATTSGVTDDKHDVRYDLIYYLFGISSDIFAFAVRTNNNTLKSKVDFPISFLEGCRESELVEKSESIAALTLQNLRPLASYGITNENVTELQTRTERYVNYVPMARTLVSGRMAAGDKLVGLFSVTDKQLDEEADRMMEKFRTTQVDFYNTYQNARSLIEYGTRHEKAAEDSTVKK